MIRSQKAGLILALVLAGGLHVTDARAGILFNTFATPNGTGGSFDPIGFAYAGNKFVGSLYFPSDPNHILYSTDLTGHNIQPFGTGVSIPTAVPEEHFVASSLGLGGFPSRDIYVGALGQIIHISNDGTTGGPFVTGLNGEVRGILFDPVGTFGNDMLVSTSSGTIYKVGSQGHATVLASIGTDTEGMDVAPVGGAFGPFGGQLFVASETTGLVRAVDTHGNVTILNPTNPIAGAEQLAFVPLNLGMSGNPLEGLYSADYPVDVIKADANQFTNFLGDLIVSGEFDHQVTRVHFNGSG
jgi:hypothetical protein